MLIHPERKLAEKNYKIALVEEKRAESTINFSETAYNTACNNLDAARTELAIQENAHPTKKETKKEDEIIRDMSRGLDVF